MPLTPAIVRQQFPALADFLNAASPAETIFDNNRTTFTLPLSRSPAWRLEGVTAIDPLIGHPMRPEGPRWNRPLK